MRVASWIAKFVVRIGAGLLLKVEITGLDRVPRSGPVIVVINHINFVEPLLLYVTLPRPIIALAKAELWGNPITRLVAQAWRSIPIRRGEMDLGAMRAAVQVLHDGGMLGLAPEGTRSHHGRLGRARPGVVLVASRAPAAVLLPVAIYGQEQLLPNLRRLRRTPLRIVIGNGFRQSAGTERVTHEARQAISDEIMLRIAALLPPSYHGVYANTLLAERYTRACEAPAADTRPSVPCA